VININKHAVGIVLTLIR